MNNFFILFVIFVSCLVGIVDLSISYTSFKQTSDSGRYFGFVALFAAIVDFAYLFSTLAKSYRAFSFFSSLYFCGIDLMLLALVLFVHCQIRIHLARHTKYVIKFLFIYGIFDIAVLLINIFYELAVSYTPSTTLTFPAYHYVMHPLYIMHLVYTYSLTICSVVYLIYKAIKTPPLYRRPYLFSVVGIFVILLMNAAFLYLPKISMMTDLDYSVWFYFLVLCLIYWSFFIYSRGGMVAHFRRILLENIYQGIVYFNYEDRLILANRAAKNMLMDVTLEMDTTLQQFAKQCHMEWLPDRAPYKQAVQCYFGSRSKTPVRLDYRPLTDHKDRIVGKMFIFTNLQYTIDVLTGFHNIESFEKTLAINRDIYQPPTAVIVCDVNNLREINDSLGHDIGDQALSALALGMRESFPSNTYFLRAKDAMLVALFPNTTETEAKAYIDTLKLAIAQKNRLNFTFTFQAAVTMTTPIMPDITKAIHRVERTLIAKKLVDRKSSHSTLLNSLVKALHECDVDTEAHVLRTQKLGRRLGSRLGLNDAEQSNLALLCVMHDIGKIGIPLEILNKPTKLTDAEWKMMQSHTEKGYHIASASAELSGIADMILHHHERWDGKGYPEGLSKESIPLLSRIISVVDAYDAMISTRVYSPPMTQEEAMQELVRCAGTQFDPLIVSELVQMLHEEKSDKKAVAENKKATESAAALPEKATKIDAVNHGSNLSPLNYSRYILDNNDKILVIDRRFTELTGYTEEDIEKGLSESDLIFPEERLEYFAAISADLSQNGRAYLEHRIRRKDGSALNVFCFGRRYFDSAERSGKSEIFIININETQALSLRIEELTLEEENRRAHWEQKYRCDSLTGLLTHESFKNDLEDQILKGKHHAVFLMMDIDHFKQYNDSHGHQAGDAFLTLFAESLKESIRKDDLVCRIGGDEFAAALFYNASQTKEDMLRIINRIYDHIDLTLKAKESSASLSMGIAFYSAEDSIDNFNKLYAAADSALYASKNSGRSCISVYHKENED